MDVPSWVPDLGNLGYECRRKFEFHRENSRNVWAGGTSNFHAVATKEPSVLQIRGMLLGCIDKVCIESQYRLIFHVGPDHETEDAYLDRLIRNLFPWFVKVVEFFSAHAEPDTHDGLQLKMLLLHGQDLAKGFGPSNEQSRETFRTWQASAQPAIKCDIEPAIMYKALNEFIRMSHSIPGIIDRTRVLALTTTGHVGWIPEAAVPGDFVTLFRGSPYPFILRQRPDGYYSVIGDAYIQGIMHGEAWPEDGAGVDWIEMK